MLLKVMVNTASSSPMIYGTTFTPVIVLHSPGHIVCLAGIMRSLFYFALPLGLRHKVDAQAFLRMANQSEAAELIEQQASLLGQAQYAGVQHAWSAVATLIEQVAILEERLITVCRSW